jgi:hypothetical protein
MGEITIHFVGVCVHVGQQDIPSLPCAHRVVLISNPKAKKLLGRNVEPHIPTLILPQPAKIDLKCVTSSGGSSSYTLQGVTLSIANAARTGFVLDPTYSAVPRLAAPGASLSPNLGVIVDRMPPVVATFDLDNGTLVACMATENGAIGTSAVIQTDGDPVLELTCFVGESTQVPFPTGAVLLVTNSAAPGFDDDADFLLSYEVCASIPASAKIPSGPPKMKLPACFQRKGLSADLPIFDLGPSCSNSGYP